MSMKIAEGKLDIPAAAGYLKLPEERLENLTQRRLLVPNKGRYQQLFHFETSVSGIERGSVLYQKENGEFELIHGFPKIRRAMLLEPAIRKQFINTKTLCVEEKMNGYNVRVILFQERLIALTRGGNVCPYSTEKANLLLNIDFFRDNPDYVLHGEMIGPENPYVPKEIYGIESLAFFVFDIREKNTGEPVSISRRRQLAEEYGFLEAPLLGNYKLEESAEAIFKHIQELGKIGHEGVVIKDPEMIVSPIKYTCSQSNCSDLLHAFKFYNDVGRDYLFSRVVREGFQSAEWSESENERSERCLRLGESILVPMIETVKKVRKNERVIDEVRIRVQDLETLKEFEDYSRLLGLEAIFSEPEKVGDEYLIHIHKINRSTSDKTEAMWNGDLW
ncbi:putative ATP-dependent DNA ligase [Methanohalophilus levihalophilus]|uniref:RNA ligase n=1 Tax=Methanohalophilus levihalophilus TaxID=1431282 RepID=UPI001FD9996B|nr:RNA ligase [Methanohalophilus levihalophilus]MBP2029929.1 putative ATP-dependent DNA ligase [Methanohalophilus levihalophilus]